MPVFPWRFIDFLLGRSRPGDEDPASAEDIDAEVTRLSERLSSERSEVQTLIDARTELLGWAELMLSRRAPVPDGRSRRDVNVQLGAVLGAIRAVLRTLEDVFARADDDASGTQVAWRLKALESEIAAPLYTVEEQPLIRARLERTLAQLESEDLATPPRLTAEIIAALTPPER